MEYVLLHTKHGIEKSDENVEQDIKTLFGDATNNTFVEKVKHTNVEMCYAIQKRAMADDEGMAYYMTLVANGKTTLKSLEALEKVHFKISENNAFRSKYHIVTICDDVSSHYCKKAYPAFHDYEKQMRRLLYKYLTMTLGA